MLRRLRGRGLEKIARRGMAQKVFCSILCDGRRVRNGRPSRKFGCAPAMAGACSNTHTPVARSRTGVVHVGSQQREPRRGTARLKASAPFSEIRRGGHRIEMLNLGAGFLPPSERDAAISGPMGDTIFRGSRECRQSHPRDDHRARPRHGRQNAGVIEAEVVLISRKSGRGRRIAGST